MDELYQTALNTFTALLDEAKAGIDPEPTAMTVATVGRDGRPAARTVLLKGFDARGFVFYTNFSSRKGRQLAGNPQASVSDCWRSLRIMVADVDALWQKANQLQLRIGTVIGDRPYGLRDFVIIDPAGFGLRFAQVLTPP